MNAPASTESPEDDWAESEYSSLIKHFEEIYKLSAASITAVVAGAGAVLAYGGVSILNLAIVCLLIFLWFFAFLKPIFRYTYDVLDRLAELEEAAHRRGHFFKWREGVRSDTWGITHTGTFAWRMLLVGVVVGFLILAVSAMRGDNLFPPPVEISISRKTEHGEILIKSTARGQDAKAAAEEMLRRVQALKTDVAAPAN